LVLGNGEVPGKKEKTEGKGKGVKIWKSVGSRNVKSVYVEWTIFKRGESRF